MGYFELGFVVAFAAICLVIFFTHKRAVRLEQERHERVMREIDANNEKLRKLRAERRAAMTASPIGNYTSNRVVDTKANQRRYADDRTMIYNDDSGAEILTQMILQQALNSSSDTSSGSVRWDNDTPTITPSSSYESSSSSSYSSYSSDSSSSYSSSDSGSSSSSCD